MSRPEPIEPSEPKGSDAPNPSKPDWLVGADEGARRAGGDPESWEGQSRPKVPVRPPHPAKPPLELVAAPEDASDETAAPEPPEESAADAAGTGAWKAAASSVPRLRQQPAAATQPAAEEFAGFAQDAMMARSAPAVGGRGVQSAMELLEAGANDAMPLAQEPPFWVLWLEQLRSLPRPVLIGAAALLVLGAAVYLFYPRGTPGISLAQIRQRPEAFEGRSVRVGGKVGESFSVGESFVFNLYQGRDTIVVYTRTAPPRLNERVKVDGTVSIGYLDGVPRVALLESASTP